MYYQADEGQGNSNDRCTAMQEDEEKQTTVIKRHYLLTVSTSINTCERIATFATLNHYMW